MTQSVQEYNTFSLRDFMKKLNQLLLPSSTSQVISVQQKTKFMRVGFVISYRSKTIPPPPPASKPMMDFDEGPFVSLPMKEIAMGVTVLRDSQFTTLRCRPLDAAKMPVALDPGVVPTWQVSDPNVLTIEPAADGLSCKVTSTVALGTAGGTLGNAQVTCDAVLADQTDIKGIKDYTVGSGPAVVMGFDEDTPQDVVPAA